MTDPDAVIRHPDGSFTHGGRPMQVFPPRPKRKVGRLLWVSDEPWFQTLPEAAAKAVHVAFSRVGDVKGLRACSHLRYYAEGMVCVTHPKVVRCGECTRVHIARSPHDCLGCGSEAVVVRGDLVCEVLEHRSYLRGAQGGTASAELTHLSMVGVALCVRCGG